MKQEDRQLAIEIISQSNSCTASFNVPVENNYSNVHQILIHECNANLINQLTDKEFKLSMSNKGLSVDKY